MVDWFIPGYKAGGPIQSCLNLAKALKDKFEVYVLTSDRDHGDKEPYKDIVTNTWLSDVLEGVKVFYVKQNSLNSNDLAKIINEINPEVLYLNQLFSKFFVITPLWLKWKNKIKARVILCPRGVLHKSALSLKSYKKIPFIKLLKLIKLDKWVVFHATNEEEEKNIKLVFKNAEVIVANNLPDMDQPPVDYSKLKKPGELSCLTIARIVSIKNIFYFLEVLKNIKVNINYTIAGPIEDKKYWESCIEKIKELPSNIKVKYIGSIEKIEVSRTIADNHLFVLPTTGENFGHAIFEALLVGRPVLISDQTPWRGLEKLKIGWDINLSKPEEFENAINKAAQWDQEKFDDYVFGTWHFANEFINNSTLINLYLKMFSPKKMVS